MAQAAGIGAASPVTVLGQPLDFVIALRLDAGETLSPECVNAEVTVGDQRLSSSAVRTVIERLGADSARVRVQTQAVIDEPVLAVQLTVGCAARVTRRFVVLADPAPGTGLTTALTTGLTTGLTTALTTALATAPTLAINQPALPAGFAPAAGSPSTAAPAVGDQADPASISTGTAQGSPPRQRNQRATAVGAAKPKAAARKPTARTGEPGQARSRAGRAERPARLARVGKVESARPPARLKMDFVEPDLPAGATARPAGQAPSAEVVEEALIAVAQAASAARAATSAASASAAKIATLERSAEQLRSQAKVDRDLVVALREQLALAQSASPWTAPLLGLVAVMAVLCAWLAWRLGRLQGQRQQRWSESVQPDEHAVRSRASMVSGLATADADAPSTFPPASTQAMSALVRPAPARSGRGPAATAAATTGATRAWPPAAPADTLPSLDGRSHENAQGSPSPFDSPTVITQALPSLGLDGSGAARDVSIEELIDLEQQAEFFVVLGQDDAAIDLLVDHLRSTGGGSPLPYLKLLEIYRRRGETAPYERMRTRFNHRFNAYAPGWDVDLSHGRSLEDYPGIIARLEQVWARPLDAMAELEALLFRKSRGELFELPAYREVLFLYALARDLLDREPAETGTVDLLLPLSEPADFSATAPAPFLTLEERAVGGLQSHDFDDRPTAPVDLDISMPDPHKGIFDPIDGQPRPPGSR